MQAEQAIHRLSQALALINTDSYDKSMLRELVKGLLDEKHQSRFENGISTNNRAEILHAIVGMISHYEAEKTIHTTAHNN